MKIICILVFIRFFFTNKSFGQTFRSAFDKRDLSSPGGFGLGASLESNVASELHNGESGLFGRLHFNV